MKLARLLQFAFIIAAAAVVYSFVASAQDGELRRSCVNLCSLSPNYIGDNRAAPDLQLKDLNGVPAQLSALRGKTVVLAFWTTACTACEKQMPSLAELAQIVHNDSRFALLTVAVDDNIDVVRAKIRSTTRKDNPFVVLLDPDSVYVGNRYGTRVFPETWIIDASGVIRARFDGPRDWASPSMVDLLESIAGGDRCPVELQGGLTAGRGAGLCDKSGTGM